QYYVPSNSDAYLATTCLTLLSFEEFEQRFNPNSYRKPGGTSNNSIRDIILRAYGSKYKLFMYSAEYWNDHATNRKAGDLEFDFSRLTVSSAKMTIAFSFLRGGIGYPYNLISIRGSQMPPLLLSAFSGVMGFVESLESDVRQITLWDRSALE